MNYNIKITPVEASLMEPLKQEAIEAITKLPNDAEIDEIMYQLYVLDKVRKGREAAEQGNTINHEDLKHEIDKW